MNEEYYSEYELIIEGEEIVAKNRKLKTEWTYEALSDLKSQKEYLNPISLEEIITCQNLHDSIVKSGLTGHLPFIDALYLMEFYLKDVEKKDLPILIGIAKKILLLS